MNYSSATQAERLWKIVFPITFAISLPTCIVLYSKGISKNIADGVGHTGSGAGLIIIGALVLIILVIPSLVGAVMLWSIEYQKPLFVILCILLFVASIGTFVLYSKNMRDYREKKAENDLIKIHNEIIYLSKNPGAEWDEWCSLWEGRTWQELGLHWYKVQNSWKQRSQYLDVTWEYVDYIRQIYYGNGTIYLNGFKAHLFAEISVKFYKEPHYSHLEHNKPFYEIPIAITFLSCSLLILGKLLEEAGAPKYVYWPLYILSLPAWLVLGKLLEGIFKSAGEYRGNMDILAAGGYLQSARTITEESTNEELVKKQNLAIIDEEKCNNCWHRHWCEYRLQGSGTCKFSSKVK